VVTGIISAVSSRVQEELIRMEMPIAGVNNANLIINYFSNLTSNTKIQHFHPKGKYV
jgi:hypothetical protein